MQRQHTVYRLRVGLQLLAANSLSPLSVLPSHRRYTLIVPQAVMRAWDDGLRRQSLELLLPQARPTEDGGWPGGIRQQFRWGSSEGRGAAPAQQSSNLANTFELLAA